MKTKPFYTCENHPKKRAFYNLQTVEILYKITEDEDFFVQDQWTKENENHFFCEKCFDNQ